jgi:hypothetical protein
MYSDPDQYVNANISYNARRYYMHTCFEDSVTSDVTFQFLDSACSTREVFEPSWNDWYSQEYNGCTDYVIGGCSNSRYDAASRLSDDGNGKFAGLKWYYWIIIALSVLILILAVILIIQLVSSGEKSASKKPVGGSSVGMTSTDGNATR